MNRPLRKKNFKLKRPKKAGRPYKDRSAIPNLFTERPPLSSVLAHTELTCPCCKKQVLMKNTRLPQIRQRLGYSSELSMAKEGTWACNSCIAAGRAIVPSYKNHYYGYGVNFYPPVMYVNKTLSCQRCQKSFDFTAEEQWHYYEELRLEFSTPRYCLPCRALARKERQLHQTIGGVLSRYAPHSLEANRTLAELYTMVGNARKAGIYRARARALES